MFRSQASQTLLPLNVLEPRHEPHAYREQLGHLESVGDPQVEWFLFCWSQIPEYDFTVGDLFLGIGLFLRLNPLVASSTICLSIDSIPLVLHEL